MRAVGPRNTISRESDTEVTGNLFRTIEIPSQAESKQPGVIKSVGATAGRCNDPFVKDCATTECQGDFTAGAEQPVLQIINGSDPSMPPNGTWPPGVAIENACTTGEQQQKVARI